MGKQKIRLLPPERCLLYKELKKIGVHDHALYLYNKGLSCNLKLANLTCGQANILKQEAIASGIDAAVSYGVADCSEKFSDVLILGHYHGVNILIERLKRQKMGLNYIASSIEDFLRQEELNLKLRDKILFFEKPLFMGVLNVTPDSFSDGGLFIDKKSQIRRIDEYVDAGVNIIDIGGQSTRPGSAFIKPDIEFERIKGAVEYAVKCNITVSVDTFNSEVAEKVLDMGAAIINDISGLSYDSRMASTCARYMATICIMHMKGIPETMQDKPFYNDILDEVFNFLDERIDLALEAGIHKDSIIIDPGFGFGKNLEHNITLLKYLQEFKSFKKPLLVGISRKTMVGELTGKKVEERVLGSKILETIALLKGANIIRAHDIDETRQLLNIINPFVAIEDND